jgi:hypothetical protein
MTDIISAILAINPKAVVSVKGDSVSKITWLHGTTPIPTSDILAKQKELIADYNSKEYQRKREFEYPPIAEQLDDLYHNGIDGWKSTIKAIKDKYPKE